MVATALSKSKLGREDDRHLLRRGEQVVIVVGIQHVVPTADLIEHNTDNDSADCVCGPRLEVVPVEILIGDTPTEGEGHVYVHHSLDGREKAVSFRDEAIDVMAKAAYQSDLQMGLVRGPEWEELPAGRKVRNQRNMAAALDALLLWFDPLDDIDLWDQYLVLTGKR